MSDVDKSAVTQTENVSDKPRRRGCLGHCARFWWAYLIVLVIIVVIVVPVVLLVGVPKIAQQKLDDAQLELDGITVSNTQTQNMTMAINSTIRSDGSVHATIDAFQGVMYLEDKQPNTPFAKIDFPQTNSDAFQTVNVSQFLPIDDVQALTVFNTWLLANESLRVTVLGDTHVRVRGISRDYPVTFKKTVSMPGLNAFTGTVVNQTSISLELDVNGNNFNATAYIPNRSLFDFELGNVTFRNYLFGKEIGTVYIDNLRVRPGMNVYHMRATIEQGPVVDALGRPEYCQGPNKGILPFEISGKSVVNHGQPLSYFADALAAVNQSIPINIGAGIKNSLGIDVPCSNNTGSHS
ncbi:hypothetical protein C8A03DRAFT_42127 [Achaetomium macrosporum]|uniref:Uncharacterized protein n=1 Tax=Achaetomium macrosporum TaxID=79813 RepID=A0AAN7CE06_9PEZI|nr:hypothetical protein C8A03DRAFT_42127 [Achaetomium macrosporum]